ncbi:MAG: hypothetical protein RSC43_07650, partial [Clostridia bacterium]
SKCKNARLLPIPPERGGSPKLLPIAVNGGVRTDGGRTHRFAHTGIGIAAGIKTGTAYAKTRGVTRARIDVMLESADACGASQTLAREVFDVMRSVDAPVVFDANMTENERGFYSDGVLHLNPKKADIRTYLHELAHDTERKSGYSEYASYVLGNLRKSQDYDEYRTIITEKYRAEGKNLADADLDHEMVAAFTESALGDADFIARLRSDAPNVFRQFKQWLDDCITRFRAKKNLTPEEREIYDRMQTSRRLFESALQSERTGAADGGKQSALTETLKDGTPVYKTDFLPGTTQKEKRAKFKERIMTIFNLGAVSKKIDVKKINVFGDKYTISKNLFGDIYASDEEKRAKINALYDMADILNRAEFIGKRPEPSYASDVPPKNAAHEGVKYWHKFKTDIILDGAPYTVIFNICDKGKEQFAYLIEFKEKERPTCHTVNKDFGLKCRALFLTPRYHKRNPVSTLLYAKV